MNDQRGGRERDQKD